MTIEEFVEETANIEKYYGKELDKFQRNIWYQEIGNMEVTKYRQLIKLIFRRCKFMPKLAEMIELQNEVPRGMTRENNINCKCKKCDSKGFILYNKVVENGLEKVEYTYVARCECQNGRQFIYDGTKVADTRHRSKYYVPTLEQVGIRLE